MQNQLVVLALGLYFLIPLGLAAYALRQVNALTRWQAARGGLARPLIQTAAPEPPSPTVTAGQTRVESFAALALLALPSVADWPLPEWAMVVGAITLIAGWGVHRKRADLLAIGWIGCSIYYWGWDLTRFEPPVDWTALLAAGGVTVAFGLASRHIATRGAKRLASLNMVQAILMVNSLLGWNGLLQVLLGGFVLYGTAMTAMVRVRGERYC